MSTFTDLRDSVAARVRIVHNIGVVHARQRYTADQSKYLAVFGVEIDGVKQIRGWTVTRERLNVDPQSFGKDAEEYVFVIRGYLGFADASDTESTFQDLIDDVVHALNGRVDLDIATVVLYAVGPAFCRLTDVRQFGSTLCHYVEIEYPVSVQRVVTYA